MMRGARCRWWLWVGAALVSFASLTAHAWEGECSGPGDPTCDAWYPAGVTQDEREDFDRCHEKSCEAELGGGYTCSATLQEDRPGCCWDDADCADDNDCTPSTCSEPQQDGQGGWYHICDNRVDRDYDGVNECCETWEDCDDDDEETYDTCLGDDTCVHMPEDEWCGPPSWPACEDDGDPCTAEVCCTGIGVPDAACLVPYFCAHVPIEGCCVYPDEEICDDGNPCTYDNCCASPGYPWPDECTSENVNRCVNVPDPLCCLDASECDDQDICTDDVCCDGWADPHSECQQSGCANLPIADCCVDDADCDDGIETNRDVCDEASNFCYHVAPQDYCGHDGNLTCTDGLNCTDDTCCLGPGNPYPECEALHLCVHRDACDGRLKPSAQYCNDGQCYAEGCVFYHEPMLPDCCDDDDPCTQPPSDFCHEAACLAHQCGETRIPGCCLEFANCTPEDEDPDPCMVTSYCDLENNLCASTPIPGDCCPTGENSECTESPDNPCTTDTCEDDGAGNLSCAHVWVGNGCCWDGDPDYRCPEDGLGCTAQSCASEICSLDLVTGCTEPVVVDEQRIWPYRMSFTNAYYDEEKEYTYYAGEYHTLSDFGWHTTWSTQILPYGFELSTEGEVAPNRHLKFVKPGFAYTTALGCAVAPPFHTYGLADASVLLRLSVDRAANTIWFSVRALTTEGNGWPTATVVVEEAFTASTGPKFVGGPLPASVLGTAEHPETWLAFCVRATTKDDVNTVVVDDVVVAPGKIPELLPIDHVPLVEHEVSDPKITVHAKDDLATSMTFFLLNEPAGLAFSPEADPEGDGGVDGVRVEVEEGVFRWVADLQVDDIAMCGAAQPDRWTVTVRAVDDYGLSAEQTFDLVCGAAPVVGTVAPLAVDPETTGSQADLVTATDADSSDLEVELLECPEWLEVPNPPEWVPSPSPGHWAWDVQWTEDVVPGLDTCTFRVEDEDGLVDYGVIPIEYPLPIVDPLDAPYGGEQYEHYEDATALGTIVVEMQDDATSAPAPEQVTFRCESAECATCEQRLCQDCGAETCVACEEVGPQCHACVPACYDACHALEFWVIDEDEGTLYTAARRSRWSVADWATTDEGVTWTGNLELDLRSGPNKIAPAPGTYSCTMSVANGDDYRTDVVFEVTVTAADLGCSQTATCPALTGYGPFCNPRGYCEYEPPSPEYWAVWEETAGAPVVITERVVTDAFIYVPPGTFWMGHDGGRTQEAPRHSVEFAGGYWIARYEGTTAAFVAFENHADSTECGLEESCADGCSGLGCTIYSNNPATFIRVNTNCASFNGTSWSWTASCANHPATRVTWKGAVEFCQWLGDQRDADLVLCNEAQWERAARGDRSQQDDLPYPWDEPGALVDPTSVELANCTSTTDPAKDCLGAPSNRTMGVGYFEEGASPFGCDDMAGNVTEWTADSWHTSYDPEGGLWECWNPEAPPSSDDPPCDGRTWGLSPQSYTAQHPVRGGGFRSSDADIRGAWRLNVLGEDKSDVRGFRCCTRHSEDEEWPE